MRGFREFLEKMDKTKWLIVGLCSALLLIIALPVDERDDGDELVPTVQNAQSEGGGADWQEHYKNQLERKLEEALSDMDGVGRVQVMLTFADNGEYVVEKDITRSQSAGSGENTGDGGSLQYQESTVYQEGDGKEPYVRRTQLPAVEGALIIAQGGGDSQVRRNITDAVQALFPVEAHKIKVVRMKE